MEASEKSSFLLQYLATDMRLVSPPVRGEIVTRLEMLPPAVEHYGAIDWRVTWKSGRRVPQSRSCLQATLDQLWPPSGRLTAAEVVLQALVVQRKDGVDDVGHNALRRLSGGSLDDHLISCSPFRRILTVATSRTNYFGWLASGFSWSWTSSVHRMMDEAEKIFRRALEGKEKALGINHTSTLGTVNNLGLLYAGQGKLEKAKEMFRRALEG
jgi:tetratricopeptide (TPR) repeat protein